MKGSGRFKSCSIIHDVKGLLAYTILIGMETFHSCQSQHSEVILQW